MLHQRVRWQILLPLGMLLFSTLACGGFQIRVTPAATPSPQVNRERGSGDGDSASRHNTHRNGCGDPACDCHALAHAHAGRWAGAR